MKGPFSNAKEPGHREGEPGSIVSKRRMLSA